MKNKNFSISIVVDQTPEETFNVILNVRAWWSGLFDESFEGNSDKLGDEFNFLAGGGVHSTRQKLVELVPNKKVVWLVTESNLSFVDTTDEWTGTKISFELFAEGDGTRIVFTHIGLVPEFECYDSCAPAWTQYVKQQLANALIQAS
jgi:hypothetical protein